MHLKTIKDSFKGFTLVEVLIVIIIIGILIAALLPRLTGSQARARDTARSAMVNQISNGLSLFINDAGSLSTTGVICASALTQFSGFVNSVPTFLSSYMSSLPKDPQTSRNNGLGVTACSGYAQVVIANDGKSAVVYSNLEGTIGANVNSGGILQSGGNEALLQGYIYIPGTEGFAVFVRG